MPSPNPLRIALDAAGFYVALAAVLSLLLAGCGQEAPLDVHAAEPRPAEGERPPPPEGLVAVREVCSVTLLPDGQVQCTCEVVR